MEGIESVARTAPLILRSRAVLRQNQKVYKRLLLRVYIVIIFVEKDIHHEL